DDLRREAEWRAYPHRVPARDPDLRAGVALADPANELVAEARLADAGRPGHERQARSRAVDAARPDLFEPPELAVAADACRRPAKEPSHAVDRGALAPQEGGGVGGDIEVGAEERGGRGVQTDAASGGGAVEIAGSVEQRDGARKSLDHRPLTGRARGSLAS